MNVGALRIGFEIGIEADEAFVVQVHLHHHNSQLNTQATRSSSPFAPLRSTQGENLKIISNLFSNLVGIGA